MDVSTLIEIHTFWRISEGNLRYIWRMVTSVSQWEGLFVKGVASKWTSWEGHNYVLKGLVDELISLGARPQLKLIALQLWAKYLCKLEIAFTSKTSPILPKFGFQQVSKDYAIIQARIKERKSNIKRMLKAKPSSSESHHVSRKVDRELAEEELASIRDVQSEISSRIELRNGNTKESDEDDSSSDATVDEEDRIQFNTGTQTAIKKMTGVKDFTIECVASLSTSHDWILRQIKCFDPMSLTKNKVLGILCLALFFSKESIQISDLMRWIREDHVPYKNLPLVFPEMIKFTGSEFRSINFLNRLRYKSIQRCAFHIANMMGVEVFPAPDMAALIRRFVLELQLPSMLGDYVERLMVHCRIGLCKRMMNYEAVVVSFIIVVLKTLFGLDGRTEHSISEFALEINGMMDEVEASHLGSRLFVWDDWVRYIECRKSVIITKHFPSKIQLEQDLSTAAGPYAHYCTKMQIKDELVNERKLHFSASGLEGARRKRQANKQNIVAQLPTWKKIKKGFEFPPSLTPQVSYLEQIMSWNKSGTVPNVDILTYDHTTTSLEFLSQPNKIKEWAHSQGVEVVIRTSPVYQNLEYIVEGRYTSLRLPASTPEIFVQIKEDEDSQLKPQVLQWPPEKMRWGKRRNVHSNSDGSVSLKKKRRKERETNCSNCMKRGERRNVDSNSDDSVSLKKKRRKERETSGSNYSYHSTGKHSSNRVQSNDETRATSSPPHNTLTLRIPFSAYWVYEIVRRQPEESFVNTIEPDFSHSFRWLLNECTRVLEMKTLDLYRVLRQVERLCAGDVDPTVLHLKYRVRDLRWKDENLL